MKLVSFNVNGLRSRLHALEALVENHAPDIIGLQETKVQDQDFPVEAVNALGYQVAYFGQKTHYGVALLSKETPVRVEKGFPGDDEDAQKRVIMGSFTAPDGSEIKIINGYFPQGESRDHPTKFPAKEKYYADLLAYLRQHCDPAGQVVVMGDMNVAPLDTDIGIGEQNAKRWLRTGKTSFLPEEREWWQALATWGLDDSFRLRYPDVEDRFSWFDYRSRGFEADPKRGLRIDQILVTSSLAQRCTDAGIDYDIRGGEKPSDHCPIWAGFR